MKKLLRIVREDEVIGKALWLAWRYPVSLWGGLKHRELFEDIERYCMFTGCPRSGHSLIGSLLDAHPNMVLAHELNTLKYIYAGFGKRQIYYLLLKTSQAFTKRGHQWAGYTYAVPRQWQGRFKKLQVIGDKKGGQSTLMLSLYPGLLQRLQRTINTPIRLIHVIRNPYDNITTMYVKEQEKALKGRKRWLNLRGSIDWYFSLCETVIKIKKQIRNNEIFELRHERFLDDPENLLKQICTYLGIDAPKDYLRDCASIVFKSPHKTRYNIKWNNKLIDIVEEKMAEIPFLKGYSFED